MVTREEAVQRRLTERFISADPTALSFVRVPLVANGSGGYKKGSPSTLPPQTVKLSWQQDTAITRETEDGRDAAVSLVLVLPYDGDVERWDTFTMDGDEFEVVFVKRVAYEVKAEVIRRG